MAKKNKAAETEVTETATAANGAEAKVSKSIVDPKYRAQMNADWMAGLIGEHCVKDNAIDIDALTRFATINGLDVAKFETQKDTHGFPGRYRMTIGNMLRSVAKKRHGLFVPKGATKTEWLDAPADWLTAKSAPEMPTHDRKGAKIKIAPAEKESVAA